jgi:acetyl esterase/lipase
MVTLALMLAAPVLTADAPAAGWRQSATPVAQDRTRWRDRIAARRQGDRAGDESAAQTSMPVTATIRTGSDRQQSVDYYAPPASSTATARPPLAIFIHGGGWRMGDKTMVAAKPEWFGEHGWAFASIGYRLLPDAPVEDQARDVAAAIHALRAQAARLGFDPDRILLIGHSAGAHLAALVSTEEDLLGADLPAIRCTILLDGAGYDVPVQMRTSPMLTRLIYRPAFGDDPARQRALSPITHVGGADVRDWLIVYSTQRHDSPAQAQAMGAALARAGATVAYAPLDNSHREINLAFGTAGYGANDAVEAAMRRVAGTR